MTITAAGASLLLCANLALGAAAVRAPRAASPLETLAARELARYLYLRTGALPPVSFEDGAPRPAAVAVGTKTWSALPAAIAGEARALGAQQYLIRTDGAGAGKRVWIVGGDGLGALYGAYRFLEKCGIRFYLHQDVIPEANAAFSIPDVRDTGKPLFELRGLDPWGGHVEGIDLWDADEYKAVFAQMVKLRMNAMFIHSYPYLPVGVEPGVWVGLPQDVGEDGRVRFSPASSYWNTARAKSWGYMPRKTSRYRFGGSLLFESDEWGSGVMGGHFPHAATPEGRNEVFHRAGELFRDAFSFARALGVKTALGTEAGIPRGTRVQPGEPATLRRYGPPIMVAPEIRARLEALGKDPKDPAVVEELYRGVFQRIARTHPLDYFVLFTQESWYWDGYGREQFDFLTEEWRAALLAWEKVKPPFGLAASGWVLGPDFDRAALDHVLPKHVALTEMSRAYNAPVDEAFTRVEGRPKWAIPWIEEDSPIITPQLWAGRIRKDAADALAYGCSGLMVLHWRTLITEPAAAAVAQAGWDQQGWNPEFGKAQPAPPPSSFHVEGPVSPQASVRGRGYGPDRTPKGAIDARLDIARTLDDPVYRTYREGLTGYRLRLPRGRYRLVLKFAEPEFDAAGRRVFDVAVQGRTVLPSLDIFARAGRLAALDIPLDVEVGGYGLRLDFKPVAGKPLLCGMEVAGAGIRRRVNCGGGDYREYRGDSPPWPATQTFLWGRQGWHHEPRGLPVGDLYRDWAEANFGREAGPRAAEIFSELDGRIPLPGSWQGVNGGGAGGLAPDPRPWEYVRREWEFVDRFAALAPQVRGTANRERFEYWLNQFRYSRATARAVCLWGWLESALKEARNQRDPGERRARAAGHALPIYRQLVASIGEAYRLLLATVSDLGGMGTVANWEGHNALLDIERTGAEIAALTGEPLPADAHAPAEFQGRPRLIVPTIRTLLARGEPLRLKVLVLDNLPARSAALYWRPLGPGPFRRQDLTHVARAVYSVRLPAPAGDFEYYVAAETAAGAKLVWPAPAPLRNQTVVVWDNKSEHTHDRP